MLTERKATPLEKNNSVCKRGHGKKQAVKEPAKKKVADKEFNIQCISSPPSQVRKNIVTL